MKQVCETLGVSRSGVYKASHPRCHYVKADDRKLLPLIERILHERPSYGYRRICALINRELQERVNHKRIYRIMKQAGLLLPRHQERPEQVHNGRIIADSSNSRWCSDVFEIKCFNGEHIQVCFILDCHDREIISYTATSGYINSDMVCDMALCGMEYRFGRVNALPEPIEWLTDNGPCYTSRKTKGFLMELGFAVCNTPPYSPESNGMAESFVKTFKRDYVYVNDRPDSLTVIAALDKWFEDYNEIHPHKGLKMMAPREYIRKLSTSYVH